MGGGIRTSVKGYLLSQRITMASDTVHENESRNRSFTAPLAAEAADTEQETRMELDTTNSYRFGRFSGVIRCLPIMSFASKSRVSNGTSIRAESLPYRAEWWSTYGSGCPNMARLAVHILSQTCSLIQCKENQIPFDQLHKTRNSLEHQRLSDFVFLQYNLQLRQMVHKNKEHAYVDPISFENTGVVEDWVTEPEMYLENNENTDWKALDPPSYSS